MGDAGSATLTSLTDANGNQAHLYNSLSQVAIGIERLDLMAVEGPDWSDPELRHWTAGDGVTFAFAWDG